MTREEAYKIIKKLCKDYSKGGWSEEAEAMQIAMQAIWFEINEMKSRPPKEPDIFDREIERIANAD